MSSNSAKKILSSYWDDGSVPVNPTYIAAQMGVLVLADPRLDGSGHYKPEGWEGKPLITYSPCEHPVRQRFTIAHELAHHVLGHGERNRDTPEQFSMSYHDPKEIEANKFAAELLMPTDVINAAIRVRDIKDLEKLAKVFGVSKAAMKFRLKELGYVVR